MHNDYIYHSHEKSVLLCFFCRWEVWDLGSLPKAKSQKTAKLGLKPRPFWFPKWIKLKRYSPGSGIKSVSSRFLTISNHEKCTLAICSCLSFYFSKIKTNPVFHIHQRQILKLTYHLRYVWGSSGKNVLRESTVLPHKSTPSLLSHWPTSVVQHNFQRDWSPPESPHSSVETQTLSHKTLNDYSDVKSWNEDVQ